MMGISIVQEWGILLLPRAIWICITLFAGPMQNYQPTNQPAIDVLNLECHIGCLGKASPKELWALHGPRVHARSPGSPRES